MSEYWSGRTIPYNNLEWVTKDDWLRPYLDTLQLALAGTTLDVGCGTGIITNLLPGERVVGIDASMHMLDMTSPNRKVRYVLADARSIPFSDSTFTLVTMRMVLHHVLKDTEAALAEARRVITAGGIVVVSEGIPPDPCATEWYKDVFRLKEERLTFTVGDVVDMMSNVGYTHISSTVYVSRGCSVRNWLDNNNLSEDVKRQIYEMHVDMGDDIARAYNASFTEDDVFIDMKYAIVVGG